MADRFTLGVEEEYQLCDPRTGDLVPMVDRLLDSAPAALRDRLGYELLHTVLEGHIETSASVDETMDRVRALRCDVLDLADDHGVTIGIGGVHPFADWRDQEFVDTPAYRWVGDQLRYLAKRNLSFGLHVHVGVDDPAARVYVANQLRRWCAPLLALSANAPFFEGVDTGFRTIRMHVFGSFPRTGFAPRWRDWDHVEEVVERLIESGGIEVSRQVWWNVRPHLEYGTIELRMIDMPIELERVRTFVALSQALVKGLVDSYEDGEAEWDLQAAYLADGWFKAQRFGWEAPVAHPITGERTTLEAEIHELRTSAAPAAEALGVADDAIGGLDRILASGPEAAWQRETWRARGRDLAALQREIFGRVRSGARCEELHAGTA